MHTEQATPIHSVISYKQGPHSTSQKMYTTKNQPHSPYSETIQTLEESGQ